MTWSYSTTLTASKDKVRLLIGDTNTAKQLLQDEEIAFFLTTLPDIYQAAMACIDAGLAELSRLADSKSVGPLTISYANRARDLAAARDRIAVLAQKLTGAPMPYAGGISIDDKEIDEQDTDISKGFKIGGMTNPGGLNDYDDLTHLRDRDLD